ncbi:MAG: urease accessory UreF family protein [Pseudomonadota bacterium]
MQDVTDHLGEPANQGSGFYGELLIWLSPVFPVGGFAYSQGLEAAVSQGRVSGRETLQGWLSAITRFGSLHNDLIVLSLTMRATDHARIAELAELACALQPGRERWEEAAVQGAAFRDAYLAGWRNTGVSAFDTIEVEVLPLPVAVAVAAKEHDIPVRATLEAFAVAFHSNLVSAAIRLSVIGQFEAQRLLATLMPDVRSACDRAVVATEDDLGTATFSADLASLQHETQQVRLFRS